jgi:mono/diheme cytochrome c family protein
MDGLFWQRVHGGSTHLPIVLLPLSVLFDFVALRLRDQGARRALHSAGVALGFIGVLGGCAAVIAGLEITHGSTLGRGDEKWHHLFVWPAFTISVVLVAARLFVRRQISSRSLRTYLVGMGVASALMLGGAYWGGEMLLHAEPENPIVSPVLSQNEPSAVMDGHHLFLMNCARCHGDDARGTEEGPDLTKVHKSGARIAAVVKNGIKGEMPRFDQKLSDADVRRLICFIRSLNGRNVPERGSATRSNVGEPRSTPKTRRIL